MKTVCKTSVVKPEGKTPLGRYGCRWTEYFKNGLKEICYGLDSCGSGAWNCEYWVDWIHVVDQRIVVNTMWAGLCGSGACSCEYRVDWIHAVQERVAVNMM